MKKQLFTIGLCIAIVPAIHAQTKIKDGTLAGTASLPNADAILELESTSKGLMLPRVALLDTMLATPLSAHVKGMVVYDTAIHASGGITPGIYYNDGAKWVKANNTFSTPAAWQLQGNAGTTPPATIGAAVGSAHYWGTSDANNLAVATNGITRMIFDTAGNAYGGTDGSYVPTVTANGGNRRNFIWGRNNTVSDATSLGNNNANAIFGANNKVIGGGSLFGSTNVVGGGGNTVAGSASAVFGGNNTDSALYTIIGGINNTIAVNGANSLVVGGDLTAADGNYLSGRSSAVFGVSNKDSAAYTLVSGQNNIVGGNATGAAVFGSGNTANGQQAIAAGSGTIAASSTELATGRYNKFTTGNANAWDTTDAIAQIGIGTDNSNRANAVTVLKNGYTAIGAHTAKPNSTLQVNGSVSAKIRSMSASLTVAADDYTLIATGAAVKTITLPSPAGCTGRILNVKDMSSAGGSATLSGHINGTAATSMAVGSGNQNATQLQCDGTTWWVLVNN